MKYRIVILFLNCILVLKYIYLHINFIHSAPDVVFILMNAYQY